MRQINMEGMTLASQWNNKAEADFLEERRRDYSAFVRCIRSLVRAIRNKSYREDSANVPSPREMDTNLGDFDSGEI